MFSRRLCFALVLLLIALVAATILPGLPSLPRAEAQAGDLSKPNHLALLAAAEGYR